MHRALWRGGLRISILAAAQDLALGLGYAITATSANPSGAPGAETCAEAQTYFGAGVDAYVDGGRCNGLPSTLVDFGKNGQSQVLREGPIVLLIPDRP